MRISSNKRLILLILYWICGFVATHVPIRQGEVLLPNVDKLAHFVLYGGLALLVAFWLGTGQEPFPTVQKTLLICVIYAMLDEGLQALVPSRNPSLTDWIADVLGSLTGLTIYLAARKSN